LKGIEDLLYLVITSEAINFNLGAGSTVSEIVEGLAFLCFPVKANVGSAVTRIINFYFWSNINK